MIPDTQPSVNSSEVVTPAGVKGTGASNRDGGGWGGGGLQRNPKLYSPEHD